MRQIVYLSLLLGFNVSLAQSGPSGAQQAQFDQIVDGYQAADRFMGNVIMTVNGQAIYSRSAGFANLEFQVPNQADTVFEIGSVTKSFTAVAVLKLQDQGKLKVTDPLSKYLPTFPNAAHITLQQLLSHTSGIANFTSLPTFFELQKQALSPDQVINLFRNLPPSFAPGKGYQYSNSNYVLLGKIIELASGRSYATYLQKNVLDPLGYHSTRAYSRLNLIPRRASGYLLDGTDYRLPEAHNFEVAGAAGRLFSTTGELVQWLPGVMEGKVLSKAGVAEFITPHAQTNTGNKDFPFYGDGVDIGKILGHRAIGHSGSINGFNSFTVYFPDEKLSVAAISNTDGADSERLSMDLIRAYFKAPYTLKKAFPVATVPAATLKRYVGSYAVQQPKLALKVTFDSGRLSVALPNQGPYLTVPRDDHTFSVPALGGVMTFAQSASVMKVTLSLEGANFVGLRQGN